MTTLLIFDGFDEHVNKFLLSHLAMLRGRGMISSAQMFEEAMKRGEGMAAVPKEIADIAERAAAKVFNDIMEKNYGANEGNLVTKIDVRYANDPLDQMPPGTLWGPIP